MALDKMLSENINTSFFENKIALETERVRPDGKVEVQRKGSLALLKEWLLSEISWNSDEEFLRVVIGPLREVRNLRQTPAHTITADRFSAEYSDRRKNLLWAVFNSLSNIRVMFGKHPKASGITQPPWLDQDDIDVF
jgi:hypothetical protein